MMRLAPVAAPTTPCSTSKGSLMEVCHWVSQPSFTVLSTPSVHDRNSLHQVSSACSIDAPAAESHLVQLCHLAQGALQPGSTALHCRAAGCHHSRCPCKHQV